MRLRRKKAEKVIPSMRNSSECVNGNPIDSPTEAEIIVLDSSDDTIDLDSTDSENKDASSDIIFLN